jgi:gluconate 5-dehydrogenase
VDRLFDIRGKTALVTGSSRGIGKALADGLAAAGARVIIHGRDAGVARSTAAELRERHDAELYVATFDVTDPQEVSDGVDSIEHDFGAVEILVNNAGIQRRAPFLDFAIDDWNDIVASNLTSAFLVGQRVARGMVARGRGKIVNIGSVQSQLGRPGIAPYAASKGGIVMLTRGMCADLAGYGIQVNALAPGYFETEMTKALVHDEEFSAWVRGRTPAGRWGAVEELVGTLWYLVAPASDFVNGQIIFVDGGMTAVV